MIADARVASAPIFSRVRCGSYRKPVRSDADTDRKMAAEAIRELVKIIIICFMVTAIII
ncbi:MAG TPA: hypothetical protein VIK44_09965 [Acetobacterium sp.]